MTIGSIWENTTWGHGPTTMHWFLEPTCPNSARAFGKLMPLLERAGEDRLTVRITIHSQPWHLFSSVVSRAVLAATLLADGRDKAWSVLAGVYANREDFVATDHSHGPNMEVTLAAMLSRIAECSGVDVGETFESKAATDLLKMHTRFSRQNGIHVSPSVMIDGLVNDRVGSRDEIDVWLEVMGLA